MMSLNRYFAELSRAFLAPLEQPGAWVRAVTPWFALAVLAKFTQPLGVPSPEPISFALNTLAMGGFAIHWQRFIGLDQRPAVPLALTFGPRALIWALVYQLMLGVESAPALVMAPALAGQPHADILGLAVQEAFQLLIGPMFLILPHIALKARDHAGTSLQTLVTTGGLAVGFGYVLANLPFLMIAQALANLVPQLPNTDTVNAVVAVAQTVLTFMAFTVSMGFFALVWRNLSVGVAGPAAAPPQPEPAVKPRRTERLTKPGKRRG